MSRELITRDSDGTTIDTSHEEAEQADTTARARRVILTDSDGTLFSSSNPLNVETELLLASTDLEGGGKTAVGTTAVEITFTGTTESIIISADTSNTGTLYVGKSNVGSAGQNSLAFLEAGESITLNYNDTTNALFVIASVSSQNFFSGALI